jgi:hypothetical protein
MVVTHQRTNISTVVLIIVMLVIMQTFSLYVSLKGRSCSIDFSSSVVCGYGARNLRELIHQTGKEVDERNYVARFRDENDQNYCCGEYTRSSESVEFWKLFLLF